MATQSKLRITPIKLIVVVAIVIFAAAGIAVWWQRSFTNPNKVFNRMLAHSLATPSVTKKSVQQGEAQSLNQTAILVTSPKQYVATQSTLVQGSGDQKSEIVTETLAFPTEEYTRYLSISTSQKSASGKPFDFNKLLGIWGKTTQEDSDTGGPQTYSQTALGIIPVGTLNAAMRKDLVAFNKDNDVFGVNYKNVKKAWKNNRLVYTYEGNIRPVPYVKMIKQFGLGMGMRQLEAIDPEQYRNSAPISFTVDVDVISGQMTAMELTGSGRKDSYSAYGYRPVVKVPTNVVPITELQSRLQQIQ